jgi:hypothetical protein
MTTFKIEITLPASVSFKRAGHAVTFGLEDIPEHIIAELVAHGLTQKVGDAAAGKSDDEALSKMQMTYDALRQGEWGVRRSAVAGLSTLESRMAKLVAAQMDFEKGTKTAERVAAGWARFEEMPEESQAAVRKIAERQLEREREEAEALAELGAAIKF